MEENKEINELKTKIIFLEETIDELEQNIFNKTIEFEGINSYLKKYEKCIDEIEKELDILIVGCFCGDYKCYKCNTGSECSHRFRENVRKLIKEVRQ